MGVATDYTDRTDKHAPRRGAVGRVALGPPIPIRSALSTASHSQPARNRHAVAAFERHTGQNNVLDMKQRWCHRASVFCRQLKGCDEDDIIQGHVLGVLDGG